MPKAKVKDLNMYYEVSGKGFPLIMIMGLGGNKDWWGQELVAEISKRYKAIIFDNRGTGRTETPSKDFTIRTMADDAIGLLDALKITKAHILGISLGGTVAQEIVLNYPERVEKLVLCATSCGLSRSKINPELARQVQSGGEQTPEEFAKRAIPFLFPTDFIKANPKSIEVATRQLLIAPIKQDMYMRQIKAGLGWDSYARLLTIKASTLVMQGKKDALVSWENAKILADRIPRAKLVYFKKSGHALFSVETKEVLNTLFEFLG